MTQTPPPSPSKPPGEDTSPVPVLPPRRHGDRVSIAVVALLVGLIGGLPHLLISSHLRAEGKGYSLLGGIFSLSRYSERTAGDAAQVREVLDGHLLSADPYGWEHLGDVPFYGRATLPPLLLAPVALLVGRSVPALTILCCFLLPPLLLLPLVALCRRLGAPTWVGLAAAALALMSGELELRRLMVTQTAWLIGLGAVLALVSLWDQPRWRRGLVAGLLVGATFYCDAEMAAWVTVGGALLLLASAGLKPQRRALPMLGAALALGLVIGAPVIYQALAPHGYAGKAELLARQGAPLWSTGPSDVALLAFVLLVYPKRRREFLPLAAFLCAAAGCGAAAHALGLGGPEAPWLGHFFQPWCRLTLVLMLWAVAQWVSRRLADRAGGATPSLDSVRRGQRATAIGFGALTAIVLVFGAATQARFSQAYLAFSLPPAYQHALAELALRAPADSVVVTLDADAMPLIRAETPARVFLPCGVLSPAGTEEQEDRAALAFAAYGMGEVDLSALLHPAHAVVPVGWASPPYVLTQWLFGRSWPHEAEERIGAKARFYGPRALLETPRRYRADFLWWGPVERLYGNPEVERSLAGSLFLEAGEVRIYRLPHGG